MVNMTIIQNAASLVGIVEFVNDASGGYFVALVLLSFFFILFFNLRAHGTTSALAAASFPTFIISLLLKSIDMINFSIVIVFFLLTIVAVLFKWFETTD
jgi:hypothetical protein